MGEGVELPICDCAYLNMVAFPDVKFLFILNVEEETSKILILGCSNRPAWIYHLVVCGGQLLMVAVYEGLPNVQRDAHNEG